MKRQEEILAAIENANTIIIHRHVRPDPDAIGSQVGLAEMLRASFPEKNIFQVGETFPEYDYLAPMQEISDEIYQEALVIVTDTANAPRVSDQRYALGKKVIKIDHHPNDEPYGDLLWVNTQASSCSEIIADFWLQFPEKLTLTTEAARLLYAGIVGDTGRFLYPATTAHTLEIAAKLREFPFNAAELNRQIEQVSMNVGRLSGYVYQNLEVDAFGVARVILSQAIQKEFQVNDTQTSAIISIPGTIEDVKSWAIFVEQPEGFYRVRMRSKEVPINEIAKRHHGGGHSLASGATAKDKTEVDMIYQEMQALFL